MTEEHIAAELAGTFTAGNLFEQVDQLTGEIYRKVARRRTIKTYIEGKPYFAKIHHGVGWGEIFKNLFQARLPVLGARNEWLAIQRLEQAGVNTMTAVLFCETGINPATRCSAILTKSLEEKVTLEDFETEDAGLKRAIIDELAIMSKRMHEAGVNHRDFYLCHFLMDEQQGQRPVLHLIDLHRAQIRSVVPERWLVKDLGGLLFSAFEKNINRRDLLRFLKTYRGGSLRHTLEDESVLWKKVITRARKLYLQDHDSIPASIERLASL